MQRSQLAFRWWQCSVQHFRHFFQGYAKALELTRSGWCRFQFVPNVASRWIYTARWPSQINGLVYIYQFRFIISNFHSQQNLFTLHDHVWIFSQMPTHTNQKEGMHPSRKPKTRRQQTRRQHGLWKRTSSSAKCVTSRLIHASVVHGEEASRRTHNTQCVDGCDLPFGSRHFFWEFSGTRKLCWVRQDIGLVVWI